MNIRPIENTLTVNPYGVAKQLQEAYNHGFGATWCAETALQYIGHSTLGNFSNNLQGCIDALNYLNQKAEAIRKTISFWDAYQIIGAEKDKELLLDRLAQIPNNSSLVNNVELPFAWINPSSNTEEQIYRGDTFIKDYQGNISVVHASNKGVYVPQTITFASGNSLTITYKYDDISADPIVPISTPTGTGLNVTADSGYNIREIIPKKNGSTITVHQFKALSISGTYITPIVKYFLTDTNNTQVQNEQIFLDHPFYGPTAGIISGESTMVWQVKNPTPFDLWYEVR